MGEFELLARIREKLPPPGPRVRLGSGDDAAVTVPGGATATSVDAVVDGVHFRREHASLRQAGGKALAAALSDLAAMGAEPGEAYVALGVPPDLPEDRCLELLDGILAQAEAASTTLAGGDLVRSPVLFLAVTAVGHAPDVESFVGRAGAHPGDALVLTGELGGAAAGLIVLEHPDELPPTLVDDTDALLRRQLEPQPRIAAGRALAAAGARAMIDLSDGLGADADHLAAAGGVGLRIEAEALPLAAGVDAAAALAGREPLELAAAGGEDYELLAAMPADRLDLEALSAMAGVRLSRIGEVVAGSGVEIRLPGGRLLRPGGYDQLG
jgi:thiamine-monophosphate kinase